MEIFKLILLIAGFIIILFLYIVFLLWLLTTLSGLPKLKMRYPGLRDVETPKFKSQTIMLNGVRWKKCATLSVMKEGLWLKLGAGTGSLLIPWSEFKSAKMIQKFWDIKMVQFEIGEPKVVTLTVRLELYEEMRVYLGSQVQI